VTRNLLPNIHFLRCTIRRSPRSLSQCFPVRKTEKIICYLTKPTHISPVLCVVHMVIRSMNRSLVDSSKIPQPIPYSRHPFKPSTFPFCTQGNFPSHPHSHFVHRVSYHTEPSLSQTLASDDAKNHQPNHTLGTFPSHPQSHSVHKVPFQAIHNSIPHTGYQP
jgi:hypothetical protein